MEEIVKELERFIPGATKYTSLKQDGSLELQLEKVNGVLIITADHGNTTCTGLGKLMGTGVEMETKSRKFLVLRDFADKDKLMEKYSFVEFPKYYLSKEYDYLICDIGESLDAKGEDVMTHGGLSIDEVVVPFITIKAVENNG